MPLMMTTNDLLALESKEPAEEESRVEFSQEEIQAALDIGELSADQCYWLYSHGQNWEISVREVEPC